MKLISLHNGSGDLYLKIAKIILSGRESESLIELGCGQCDYVDQLGFRDVTRVDLSDIAVRKWSGNPSFHEVDLLSEHPIFERHYGVSFCSDVIEHFRFFDAHRLLDRMRAISSTQFIFTPLGPYMADDDHVGLHSHKSYWYPHYFRGLLALECPVWHPTLHVGALFAWRTEGMVWAREITRVYHALRAQNLCEPIGIFE